MDREQMKDEAREDLKQLHFALIPNKSWAKQNAEGWSTGFDVAFNAGYEFANRWHVVERDGLPDKDGLYVITTTSPATTHEAWWNSRKEIWTTYDGGDGFDAVAWRPLPEPYKGE